MRALILALGVLAPLTAQSEICGSVPSEVLRVDSASTPEFQEARARVEAWIRSCGSLNVQVDARPGERDTDGEGSEAAAAEAAITGLFEEVSALAVLDPDQLNRRPFHLEPSVILNGVDETLLAALLAGSTVETITIMEASAAP